MTEEKFRLTKEKCSFSDALTVFRFKGSLDVDQVQTLSKAFKAAIDANQNFIISEMADVTFISSPMLGELMGCKKRLVEAGGNLYLVGLKSDTRNKLRQIGADKIFDFFHDIRSAVIKYRWEIENKGDEFQVAIPPRLQYVPEVRNLFSRVVSQRGYSKRDAFRVETIIDELCNNAIEHGRVEDSYPVEVTCNVFRYYIEISIINSRKQGTAGERNLQQINKRAEDAVSFDLNERRGRGVELVKMLCSQFGVTAEGEKTIVHVIKRKEV